MADSYYVTIIFILCVCCHFLADCSVQDSFLAWRTVNSSEKEYWHSSRDKFTIPDTLCKNSSNSNPCSLYKSFTQGKTCHCVCPYLKPSFRFYNGKWGCVDDAVLKKSEGCGFFWPGLAHRNEMPFFSPQSEQSKEKPSIDVPAQKACEVNEAASSYLACDGSWKPITSGDERSRFRLLYISLSANETVEKYELQINADSGSPDLRGRIIKLVLTCKPLQGLPCILLKITGKVKCPVDPLRSTPKPFNNISPLPVVTNIKTSKIEETTPTVKDGNQDFLVPNKSKTNVVALAVGIVALLLVVLIIIVLLWCRRRNRGKKSLKQASSDDSEGKFPDEKQKTNDDFVVPNPIYEKTEIKRSPVLATVSQFQEPLFKAKPSSQISHETSSVSPPPKAQKRKSQHKKKARNGSASSNGNYFNELKKKLSAVGNPFKAKSETRQKQPEQNAGNPEEISEYDDYDDYYDDDEWDSFSDDDGKNDSQPRDDTDDIYHTPERQTKRKSNTLKNSNSSKNHLQENVYINAKERGWVHK